MTVDVEVLTRDHKRAHHTEDGIEFHTVPSLLSQLRDAIHGGATSDGAGVSGKAKLPFQAAAMDLYMLVETEVWNVHAATFQRVNGAVHPEVLLDEWAAHVDPETMVELNGRHVEAFSIVARWVALIEDYLTPETTTAGIRLPCPACNSRYHHRWVDGEEVRSDALIFRRVKTTGETIDARCEVCQSVWGPSQYMFFVKALSAGIEK